MNEHCVKPLSWLTLALFRKQPCRTSLAAQDLRSSAWPDATLQARQRPFEGDDPREAVQCKWEGTCMR